MKLVRKSIYLLNVMKLYNDREWIFENNHLYSLWEEMDDDDKTVYNFSMEKFDWSNYFCYYLRGLQIYLLKENLDYEHMRKARDRKKW